MKITQQLVLCCLVLGSLASALAQEDGAQLRRIIDAHRRAYFGNLAGDRLTSVIIKGSQTQGEETYDLLIRKKAPNSIRFRLSNPNATIVCGYNGETAWQRIERDGKVEIDELSGDPLATLQREADFSGPLLRYYEGRGVQQSFLGIVAVNAHTSFKILVEEPERLDAYYYIGSENYYLVRRELLDDEGAVVLRSDYNDYRTVEGFPFPSEIINIISDAQRSVTTIDDVVVNPGQLNFYFEKPTH